MFRRCSLRLKYYQENFNPRSEAFLTQIMRGLKCEKRWEMGMGHGIFAREEYPGTEELIMFEQPFLSLDMDRIPETIRKFLKDFDTPGKVQEVLNRTAGEIALTSKTDVATVQAYLLEHRLDIDISWMTLLGCYTATYLRKFPLSESIPFHYFSYIDDHHGDNTMHQNMIEIAYENILDVTGLTPEQWPVEEFWEALFKYRSNVHHGELYPVAPTLVNHSCWPNAAFAKDGALVTLRPIEPDEQITVALYGSNCEDVKEKGLCGKNFKCHTPGCEWSKRVPLTVPRPEPVLADYQYVSPWHAAYISDFVDPKLRPESEQWKTPAREKIEHMLKNEVTIAGRDLRKTPQLPGSRPKRHLLLKEPDEHGNYVQSGTGGLGQQLQLSTSVEAHKTL